MRQYILKRISYAILFIFFTDISHNLSAFDIVWTSPQEEVGGVIPNAIASNSLSTAIDGSGNLIVVWDYENINEWVKYSRYNPATKRWTTIGNVSEDAGEANVADPVVASDPRGNAIVVWEGDEGLSILARRYNVSTNSWSTITTLALAGTNPQISMDNSGNGIAVWGAYTASLGAQRYDNIAATWTDISLSTGIAERTYFPQVAMNASGKATAIWVEGTPSPNKIQAARYEAGNWTALKELATSGSIPHIAINRAGNAIAVWIENNQIKAQRYNIQTGWEASSQNISDPTASSPKIAMDDNGNALAVWTKVDGIINRIQASRYNKLSDSWTPLANIPYLSADNTDTDIPQIAMDAEGNGVATWYRVDQNDPTLMVIQVDRYDKTNGWQGAQDVSELGISAWEPQIAMNKAGNASVVWFFPGVSIEASHGIPKPTHTLAQTVPGTGIQIDAGSDGKGVTHVAATNIDTDENQGFAILLSHDPNDSVNVWNRVQVSNNNQNVSQVSVNVNVNNVVVNSYVNNVSVVQKTKNGTFKQIEQGEVFLATAVGGIFSTPILISNPEHNARNVVSVVNNNVNNVRVNNVYVNNNVVVSRGSGLLEDLDDVDINLADLYRQPSDDLLYGDIVAVTYDLAAGIPVQTILYTGTAASPDTDIDGIGNPYVIWQLYDGTPTPTFKIQVARAEFVDFLLTWSWYLPGKECATLAEKPKVATENLSSALFIWRVWDGSNWRIQTSFYDGYSSWLDWAPTETQQYLSIAGADADNPAIDMDKAGNAVAAWNIFDGFNWRIQQARWDAYTKTWSAPRHISPAGFDTTSPNVHAGYTGYAGVSYNVQNVVVRNGKQVTTEIPELVISDPTGIISAPKRPLAPGTNLGPTVNVVNFNNNVNVVNVRNVVVVQRDGTRQPTDENGPILVGLSSTTLEMPRNACATQELHRFPTQGDLINILSWEAGDSAAVHYEIYTDMSQTQLLSTIQASRPLYFYHHGRKSGICDTYYIYAVNASNEYSSPAIVTI